MNTYMVVFSFVWMLLTQLSTTQIGVVHETRPYARWSESGSEVKEGEVGLDTGIMAARVELNRLHKTLADEGFNQVL